MYRRYRVRASRTLRGNGFGEQSEDRALAKKISPILKGKGICADGTYSRGAYRNRNHVAQLLEAGNTDEMYVDLLSDPQTSGGLLAAVPEEEKDAILEEFDKAQMETKVSVVGKVIDSECEEAKIYIR